jgi:O-antigen biosynthesis protein
VPAIAGGVVTVDGRFFRAGERKFYVKGCTYGPFAPNEAGEPYPSRERTRADFKLLRQLGANVIRVYHPPPLWLLNLAGEEGMKVFIDIPWRKHTCWLDDPAAMREAREAVEHAVRDARGHPAVFAFSVVNEIPPDIVRWYGAERVEDFIDSLVEAGKQIDPTRLFTFANYPPTEFLRPRLLDFVCFNVYLHDQRAFVNYLSRLQILAGDKPLMLGEFGIDCFREGAQHQAEILSWHIETVFRGGLAGTILFAFTDDWFTGGYQIENWAFGLVNRERQPKPAFEAVRQQFTQAPHFTLPGPGAPPRVSVVVASYNGGRTLRACLESLSKLNYPNYEVILVDDGSTDGSPQIAAQFPNIRYIRQENWGLSYARNAGILAATGDIVAFTDSDCRADEDWIYYLVGDLLKTDAVAIGGPNYLPPEDNWIAAAVSASPGTPCHVLLDDRTAEHIPGCNMAFWKWALEAIGGFDPIFRKAGDDVDVCWRLMQRGYKIAFSPAAFVWHYRRCTARAYLNQQSGYGEAEALLRNKHPEYFNSLGASIWHGVIYSTAREGIQISQPIIYHGVFGSALFQTLYTPRPSGLFSLLTSIEYHALMTFPLLVLALLAPSLWPLPLAAFLASVVASGIAAYQAELPKRNKRFWSRPLVALLYFLQPIVRGYERYEGRLRRHNSPLSALAQAEALPTAVQHAGQNTEFQLWSEDGTDRLQLLDALFVQLKRDGWRHRCGGAYDPWDLEVYGERWSKARVQTASENHGGNKRLIRVRLSYRWPLIARVFFALFTAADVALLKGVDVLLRKHAAYHLHHLAYLLLLLIPLASYLINRRAQRLQRLVGTLIASVAKNLGFVSVPARAQTVAAPPRSADGSSTEAA